MDHRTRLLQRYLDGRLDPAQGAAVQRLLKEDQEAAATFTRLEALDGQLQTHRDHLPWLDPQAATRRILAGLPERPPRRQRSFSLLSLVLGSVCIALAIVAGWVLGVRSDDLPAVAGVGLGSVILGLLLALTPLILRPGSGLFERLLGRRVSLSMDQRVVVGCIGVAILLGGLTALVF